MGMQSMTGASKPAMKLPLTQRRARATLCSPVVVPLQTSTSCSPPPRTLLPNRTPLFCTDQGHQKGRSPLLPSSRSNKKPSLLMDSYGRGAAGLRYGEESLPQEWGGASSSDTPVLYKEVGEHCLYSESWQSSVLCFPKVAFNSSPALFQTTFGIQSSSCSSG